MAGVWTRNYTNMLCAVLAGAGQAASSSAKIYSNNNLSMTNISNGATPVAPYNYSEQFSRFPSLSSLTYGNTKGSNTGYFIALGTGDTPATYDDYKIENYVSSFTVSQGNVLVSKFDYDNDNHTYSTTIRNVLQYTGTSELTIKEMVIGLNWTGRTDCNCIIYREVFDTPITLNQYESVVIELTQSFPLVNYQPYPE